MASLETTKRFIFAGLATTALLFAGCGGEASTGANDQDLPEGLEQNADGSYVDQEGRECNDPTPCGDCDFDCAPSGNPFSTPTPDGIPVPGIDTCADLTVNLTEAIPTVVLLIDQSGSMDANFGGINRLDATYGALMDPADGLVSNFQDSFRFGMALYTSYDGGPTCPNISDVRPQFNNYEPINRVFERAQPEEDTPTGEAITGVMRMFDENTVRGPKVLLLATDGEPDTCAEPDPQNGQEESIEAAQQAHARGVETVVLSVGDEVSERHLQDMANAGMGLAPGGAQTAPFFRADDPAALKSSMEKIITGSRECIFQIEGAIVDPKLAKRASLTVNGQPVEFNANEGWMLHQTEEICFGAKQCIELRGPACDQIQHGNVDIQGDFLCVYGDPDGRNGYGGDPNDIPGDGTTGPGGNGTTGPGSGNVTCLAASSECSYDGDCCSGVCGVMGGRSACVLN